MREPLLLPVFAVASGILAARALGLSTIDALWPIPLFLLLALVSAWRKNRWLKRTCLLLATLFLGSLAEAWHRPGPPPVIDAGPREVVVLEGCVVAPSAFARDREQFTLELEPHARVRVTLPFASSEAFASEDDGQDPTEAIRPVTRAMGLHYGQRIEIEARVRKPRNFFNPGAFDYVQYLAHQDIFWTATMNSKGPEPKVLSGGCGSRFWKSIYDLREVLLARIDRLYKGDEYTSGMMQGILLGENSHLEKIWTENFRKTGTVHALVISGTHVAVLAMALLFLLRWCGMPEVSALAVTALAAWLYALVSGFSPPVVRAAGGFSLYLGARFLFRKGRVLNLLSAVAIAFLLFDPSEITDASFQLSFLAAAAIGALAVPLLENTTGPYLRGLKGIGKLELDPHLEPKVAQLRVEIRLAAEALSGLSPVVRLPAYWISLCIVASIRAVFYGTELVLVSGVMQVALALPMAEYFHRVSLTGVTANLLIVPLLEFTVPAGFAAISTGSTVLGAVAAWPLRLAARIAEWHSGLEPSWRIADPPLWLSLAFVSALLLVATSVRYRHIRIPAAFLLVVLFGLLLWQPWPANVESGALELTVIDVGQGDSLLVVFPDLKTLLVDGGGFLRYGRTLSKPRLDTGEDVVAPYLWSRGIRRLDVIAVTHAHEDHAGGIPSLLEDFHPTQLWFGANPSDTLVQRAGELGIPVVQKKESAPFPFGGASIEILAPSAAMVSRKPGNNDSLVLRITYKKRSFLLTGDIERPVEQYIQSQGIPVHADVLKVGHHGSKTSSSDGFLDAISPSLAVISAGYENSFGHPHPTVLQRFKDHNIPVLRTDLDGLVTVRTDGHNLFFGNALWEIASNPLGFGAGFREAWGEILVH
jgi:competence protein ComEC